MRTFYVLGTNHMDNFEEDGWGLPAPNNFELFIVETTNQSEACRIASSQSTKRFFCALKPREVSKEDLP